MQKSTFHILFGIVASMWLSLLYFLSLIIHLPVIVTLLFFLIVAILAYRFISSSIDFIISKQPARNQYLQVVILTAGVALIVRSTLHQLYVNGSNDAIGMWNYYARFLSAANWKALFSITGYYHPNHPMGLSSLLAFGWKLTGSSHEIWPLAISFLGLLLIPVLIFTEVWKESIHLAIFTLILLATDLPFHGYSFAQIADLPLALCLLGAFITMRSYKQSGNKLFIFLCAALLGCCLWLKNEGLLLALVFGLFYIKELINRQNIKHTASGLLPFAIMLLIYKLFYATANDLFQSQNLAQQLTNKAAYGKIFLYLRETLHSNFYVLQAAFLLYIIVQVIRRQWLQRSVVCLTVCLCGMLSVYLIVPTNLEWQLGTSMARVLFELMPSFLFSLSIAFAEMRLHSHPPSAL